MLNTHDNNVLSWLRKSAGAGPSVPSVIVACNFTSAPQTVSFDLRGQGISGTTARTLVATAAGNAEIPLDISLNNLTLPPFGVFLGEVR
jgi:hypothetical protein